MKEILKTLFKFKWKIFLVVVLLIIQAYLDLSLPTYTSNIVNIGIQQSGIEYAVPESIRESEFIKIKDLLNYEEKTILFGSYDYENSIYKLKRNANKKELENILLFPIYKVVSLEDISVDDLKIKYNKDKSSIKQININYIKSEYEKIGLDLGKLQIRYIFLTGIKMIGISIISLLVTVTSVYTSTRIAAYFGRDLRKRIVSKVMKYESEDLKELNVATLLTRCTNDVIQIQTLVTVFLRIIIYAPILGFGAITKVINNSMGWVIALSVFVILSLIIIIFSIVMPKLKRFQDLLDKLNKVSRETLRGMNVIRAFANEKHEEKRFMDANHELTKNGLFVSRTMAIMSPTLTFLMNSVSILIVWVGAESINNSTMQVGDLIAFISYTMQIIMSFLMVSMVFVMLPRATVSIERISEIFNIKEKIKEIENPKKLNDDIKKIEFKNVYFKYPGSEENVLKDICFTACSGKTTAFIGSTGSGKSTIINLILRFFDVTSGSILIDDINIKDLKIQELREKIGYVPQKGELFSGTVFSNVCFGLEKEDSKIVEESLKISEAYDFVMKSENGIERTISGTLSNVSGGERQRLSIARAIAKNANVLIFDDSFSALDFKTDMKVRKNLSEITKDKIVFIVAQRISSIMNADNIIVIDEGSVVGVGTHEDLLKTCEIYKEIKLSQLGEDE